MLLTSYDAYSLQYLFKFFVFEGIVTF